ncbi:MAG: hypothetical protein R3A46_10700 [Thermomicrobiales bacterium]
MTVAVQGEYAIRIQRLTKRFGSFTAVDNLSFTVPHRSVFGFLRAERGREDDDDRDDARAGADG